MIAWRVQYCALWDNDEAGRAAKARAEALFGSELASRHFFLLPSDGKQKKRILQDLFAGTDLHMIKTELGLPKNTGFAKTLAALFYDSRRQEILNTVSSETKRNFARLFDSLPIE